jgi:hypothetical protein
MITEHPSNIIINNIDARSMYTLNSIANVNIDRDMHG